MRAMGILGCVMISSGCAVLDRLPLDDGRTLDPSKIYLSSTDVITVHKHEADRYACLDGPMMCSSRGVTLECRCQ